MDAPSNFLATSTFAGFARPLANLKRPLIEWAEPYSSGVLAIHGASG